ncbi:hypothetical protein [Cardiobacterium hominis]|uniref:hypothetical protein n=1 Tax=Cardiobacterium hominis TaxID=2718 RepID=UPI0028D8A73A|nr:hypothetical protein [Cardiobacterium hominis]
MIFKCEKVDEELRKKFYQEQMVLKEKIPNIYSSRTDLEKISRWWVNETHDIFAWREGWDIYGKILNGDNSDKFWLKFVNWHSDENLAYFVIDPVIIHRDTADCIKNRSAIYIWDKILHFALCKDMSFSYALPILKDFLSSFGGGKNDKYYPDFSVKFNF